MVFYVILTEICAQKRHPTHLLADNLRFQHRGVISESKNRHSALFHNSLQIPWQFERPTFPSARQLNFSLN